MKKTFFISFLFILLVSCGAPKCKKTDLSNLKIWYDYKTALEGSKIDNKPLLIYFSAYSDVNSRVFEDNILTNSCVQKKINEEFTFVQLFTDDKTSKGLEEEVKDLQFKFIGPPPSASFAPRWIVISNKGTLFKRIEGTELELLALKNHTHPSLALSESNKFISYLDQSLENIKNNDTIIVLEKLREVNKLPSDDKASTTDKNTTNYRENYDNMPANQQLFAFDFTFEKTGGNNNEVRNVFGNLIITISNPKGADLLAPIQESDDFMPLEINFPQMRSVEKTGGLKYPKVDKRIEEGIEEVLLFYDDKKIVLKQPITITGHLPFRIKGEIVFSWIYQDAFMAPVFKNFEVIAMD